MGLIIGAHISAAGGIFNSFPRAYELGCNGMQIFAKSPRGWFFVSEKLSDNDLVFGSKSNWAKFGLQYGVIHSVYLVNLAKPFSISEKDRQSVLDDFIIANKMGFKSVNVHLGKYGEYSKLQAMQYMSDNVSAILDKTKDMPVQFLFENTAGQGTEIGWNFEELGEFYNILKSSLGKEFVESKVNFCIDTAHSWGAGYNISDWDGVLKIFDDNIGIDRIKCIHLNDSKVPVGAKLDRHANLGRGFIGFPALSKVIKWASSNTIPLILETPDDKLWKDEIKMVKGVIDGSFGDEEIKRFHSMYFMSESLKKFENLSSKQEGLF